MGRFTGILTVPRVRKKHPDITSDNSLGRSHGGFVTKIHLATDGSGLTLNIVLSPSQAHESQRAQRLPMRSVTSTILNSDGDIKRSMSGASAGGHFHILSNAKTLKVHIETSTIGHDMTLSATSYICPI